METAQITHLEFKDLFVLLQSCLSKAAPLQSAAVTLKMSERGDFGSSAASATNPARRFDHLDRFDSPNQSASLGIGPDAESAILPRSSDARGGNLVTAQTPESFRHLR